MGSSLNIKSSEVYQLARAVADRSGESLTTAVEIALRERLDRMERAQKREGRLEWLNSVTQETAAIMNDGRSSTELFDALYDPATGLPR